MSQRFSENLYLTTGKMTVHSAARAVGYMRLFVRKWRNRKRDRLAAEAAAGGPVAADAPGSAPRSAGALLGGAPSANLPTPTGNKKKLAFLDPGLNA